MKKLLLVTLIWLMPVVLFCLPLVAIIFLVRRQMGKHAPPQQSPVPPGEATSV